MLALIIGVVSAVRQYSVFDHAATSFSYFGFSMPDFFFALLLQLFVIVVLHEQLGIDVLYVQGKYSVGEQGNIVNLIEHMVLPVTVLMLTSVAAWSRYQRDSMLEVLHTDYVRTAQAKGVPRRQVIRRHALRNALIPFVTVVAIDAGVLLGGVVVVERVFSWPGLGLLFFDALERVRLPGDPGVDGGGDGVRRAVQPARRHPVRRARPAHPRRAVPYRRREGARRREHARRRRVGPGPGRGHRSDAARAATRSAPRRTAASGGPRGAASATTRSRWSGSGSWSFMFLACFVGVHFAQDPNHAEPARADRRVRRRRTGSAPTCSAATVLAGAPRRPDLVEGRARRGVALDADRRGHRRAGRLLPGLARRPAHALHRPLDRAAGAAVPRGGGVDRHRRPRPARVARSRGPARHHAAPVVPAVGFDRACRARRDPGAARARVRRRGPRDRRVEHAHHHPARHPELPGTDHRERDARGRRGDPRGEHAVVPRVRHPAADAELGQPAVRLDRQPSKTGGGSPCSPVSPSSSPCSRSTSWATVCATRSILVGGSAHERPCARGRRAAGRVRSAARRRCRRCSGCRSRWRPARPSPSSASRARARASPGWRSWG